MSYKKAETNSFAEYQMSPGQRFGSAVTGNINSTEEVSRLAQRGFEALPAGLQGYEGYPSHLSEYPEFGGEFGGESMDVISQIGQRNIESSPAGLQGYESFAGPEGKGDFAGFAGFEGVEDDAFAGFADTTSIASHAQRAALEEDEEQAYDGYGGYSGLAGAEPEQSFHTFFHQASMARTDTGVIKALAKAVKVVSDETPDSIKKQYYDLVKEMLSRRKKTNMPHIDIQRAEIESNIGWLINPKLPKTGGFNAVLKKAVGTVGAKLGRGEKDQLKAENAMSLGRKLQTDLKMASPFGGYGDFGGSKLTYVGLGLAGVLAVGVAYYLWKNKEAATALKKNKRSKRRKRK